MPAQPHAGARRSIAAVLLLFAGFAAAYAAVTERPPHHEWARLAAGGYAVAAALWIVDSRRLAGATLAASVIGVPMLLLALDRLANPELAVLADSAGRWLRTGTPFPSPAEVLGEAARANPYLPGLALFGMPAAVLGFNVASDPRWLMLAASLAGFGAVARTPDARLVLLLVLTSPWAALQLATGSTDLPVLAGISAGLVLIGRDRPIPGGLALGAAAAMKALAWPALFVGLVMAGARNGARGGLGAAAGALAVIGALLLPVALADPRALLLNTVQFPLGFLPVTVHTTRRLLPGHLLAEAGATGLAVTLLLLAGAALVTALAVLRRPPRDIHAAGGWLAVAMLIVIGLAPASRYGYSVYVVGLLALPWLTGRTAALPFSPGRLTGRIPSVRPAASAAPRPPRP